MPKVQQSTSSRLQSFVSEFKDTFTSDGHVLFCVLCGKKVGSDKRFNVVQHLKTEKHCSAVKRNENKKNKVTQQLVSNSDLGNKSSFNKDLCKALLLSNIPLNKLSNNEFKSFLEKYTNENIPSETTLRKGYVDDIYQETLLKIRNYVDKKKIWVSVDETTDVTGRFVANIVIGTLEIDRAGEIFLLHCEELEKTNHSTIFKLFDKAMGILWPEGVQHDNVLLFLSDAAPYMVKAGKCINTLYSKCIHLTCLAHAFHRIAEKIRGEFSDVDKVVASVKKVFRKSPIRIKTFLNITNNEIPLPPDPILTRWGTWINATLYYCEHFSKIHSVIQTFDDDDAASIKTAKKYLKKSNLPCQLTFIKANFEFLPRAITFLEKRGTKLSDSLKIIEDTKNKISHLKCTKAIPIVNKMNNVLDKNSGYNIVLKIYKILSGEVENLEGLPEDMTNDDLAYFNYAPITSVDVERSFSIYKNLLSSNRRRFTFENIRKHLIVQCNFKETQNDAEIIM